MAQLRLAFPALVRSADSISDDHVLARYTIQSINDAIRREQDSARLHRMHMMLVASVSSVSLRMLPSVLEDIRGILITAVPENSASQHALRQDLINALFTEIMENVGDQEKEYAMTWWHLHRPAAQTMIQVAPVTLPSML